ncbi:NHLP-related RiPP peptide [Stenotrophomonas maltophilia]|uniref:NHLP-related RiPP peptide n=1 Tax=Stenotrophomonas TaxID=40323 RepID=UPI000F78F8CE|nr:MULTISPECIES: NHLP-related RiPP peptide [Stenotrophomonas]EKT4086561.1 NHLP-related RiPP peptide [Stenotrophomonas maltophilia]MBA0420235.1 putative modified peptide [Stenotrophomonas maltophilia]MBD3742415.1 NHLP-related RiPP peptide [Stenotrophomonas sp.]MBN4997915.1 NHLP-related RiPP peptide [Stenotrophomonas maltophilia]MCO7502258.1 NHLP-related RiPP peptide [Stenotrophomonas maltophilia]
MSAKSPMTTVNAGRLLDLLCSDDAFRAEFTADAGAAMARHGLQAQSGTSPCAIHNVLASKEEFQQVRQQIAALLAQRAAFTVPFMFESGHLQGSVHHSAVPQAA